MNKWIYALALALAVFCMPQQRHSLNKMKPVETLLVYRREGKAALLTDDGTSGSGATFREAVENMKCTAAGDVLLQTVDFLVIAPDCEDLLPEIAGFLRSGTQVCMLTQYEEPEKISEFLRMHRPGVSLQEIIMGSSIPYLRAGERMELEGN